MRKTLVIAIEKESKISPEKPSNSQKTTLNCAKTYPICCCPAEGSNRLLPLVRRAKVIFTLYLAPHDGKSGSELILVDKSKVIL